MDEENLRQLFEEDEIICEAFDRAEQKALLVNGILEHFPEKKLIAAFRHGGIRGQQPDPNPEDRREFLSLRGTGKANPCRAWGLMAPPGGPLRGP